MGTEEHRHGQSTHKPLERVQQTREETWREKGKEGRQGQRLGRLRRQQEVVTVARFSVRKLHFGTRPETEGDDNGEGLPTPARIKLAARRAAGIAEAKAVL